MKWNTTTSKKHNQQSVTLFIFNAKNIYFKQKYNWFIFMGIIWPPGMWWVKTLLNKKKTKTYLHTYAEVFVKLNSYTFSQKTLLHFFFYQKSWLFLHNIYRPQNSEKKFTVLMKIHIWYFIMLSLCYVKFIVFMTNATIFMICLFFCQ